ncbi:MAG: PilZ domain-containing protein [Nitrospirae bacterium]|nr:PilZ domain-containing protein [Nitrospirota bacterium]MCL5237930.1 PilZ domain-containing protein [Nitrospirota bacterium]
MAEEMIKKTDPVDIKSEGRNFKRFAEKGDIVLKFHTHVVGGKLINISTGGILGVFDSSGPLPEMSRNVVIGLEIDGKGKTFEIEGTVIRVQPASIAVSQENIEIAVKFIDPTPEKKHELRNIVHSLMRKTRGISYRR